jgi:hypothetical protein
MNAVMQEVVVGLLVAGCVVFSAWRLLSARLRLRVLNAVSALPGAGRAVWLARLRQRSLSRSGGACAGCSHADVPPAATAGASSRNQTPGALRH